MKIGVTLRNMGEQSTPDIMLAGAVAAEARGFESLWITDHIAIPPDDAEGSNGRYLDPLISLSWLAQATERLLLGTGVLILPYRPALPTAKQIATLAELSGDRLLLGVGIGWMDAEFRALGVPRNQRGRISDELLATWRAWFDKEPASANGQDFLFRPRPKRPPILVGGHGEHAWRRALRYGDAWLPMARDPQQLGAALPGYAALAESMGRTASVTAFASVATADPAAGAATLADYAALGLTRIVCGLRYADADDYLRQLDALVAVRERWQAQVP